MVSAGLSSVVQSLQAFRREDCGSDSQEQGKTQVSAGTLVILLVTWNVNVGSFPALPCLILLSMGTNFRIVAVPCLGHVRCIGDSWVLIILRGWCIAGMWQQSLQHLRGALHPLRSVQVLGVFRGGCVFDFFWCFSLCEPGRAETVDSWPVILCCVSQTVPKWLGAFLSLSPEGSAFETSLGPHLPFLLVLSCWGMLWSYFWRSFSWLKVWQTDCWNGVFLFYSYLCQNWGWPQTVTCIVTVFFTAEVMFFCNVFEKENHKQIRNPSKQNKTPKTMAPTFLPSAINPSLISGRAVKKPLLRYGVHKQ